MASMQEESLNSPSEPVSAHPTIITESNDGEAVPTRASDELHNSSDSSSGSSSEVDQPKNARLARPKMGSRKSSGTMVIPRDTQTIELEEEEYDENDARTMSPRRTSEEIEEMGEAARQRMFQQVKELQESLLEVVERVQSVKSEHEKLEGGNRFLQSYIGELMNTSKITSTGPGKWRKGKGRATK